MVLLVITEKKKIEMEGKSAQAMAGQSRLQIRAI